MLFGTVNEAVAPLPGPPVDVSGGNGHFVKRIIADISKLAFPDGLREPTGFFDYFTDERPWLKLIDGDKVWRENNLSITNALFRLLVQPRDVADQPANVANYTEWAIAVPNGDYRIQVTWLWNVTQRVNFDPLDPLNWDSGRFLKPAADARYEVLAGTAAPKNFTINQRDFATSFIDGIDFNLRKDFLTFDPLVSDGLIDPDDPDDPDRAGELLHVDNGVLRIRLYGSATGDVVAGPIRIVRADGSSFRVQRQIDPDTGEVFDELTDPQQEVIGEWRPLEYETGGGNFPLWESDILRPVWQAYFEDWQNGRSIDFQTGLNIDYPMLGDEPSDDPNDTRDRPGRPDRPEPHGVRAAAGGRGARGLRRGHARPRASHNRVGGIVVTGVIGAGALTINVTRAFTAPGQIDVNLLTNSFTRSAGDFVADGFRPARRSRRAASASTAATSRSPWSPRSRCRSSRRWRRATTSATATSRSSRAAAS